MKASRALSKLSDLALQQRRRGLAKMLPPAEETLRGSLIERYLTCGNPSCKCARGERHGPVWYLTITLGPGRTTSAVVPSELLERVRHWIENYRKVKGDLEKIKDFEAHVIVEKKPGVIGKDFL